MKNNPIILKKSDFQKFIKRLRKDYDIKYFACGEYGDKTLRPHFHAILFGVNFSDDKIIFSKSKKDILFLYPIHLESIGNLEIILFRNVVLLL